MPSAIPRSNSRRSESFWPASAVKKFFNVQGDANEFSADEDEENSEVYERNRRRLRRHSESFLQSSGTHFTYTQDFRVFVGTWNVAGKPPVDNMDLREWLDVRESVDIYVIGFQEIVPLNPGNVLGAEDEGPATKWESLIRRTLNGDTRQTNSAPASPWRQQQEEDPDDEDSSEYTELPNIPVPPKHKKSHSVSELDFNTSKPPPQSTPTSTSPPTATSPPKKYVYVRMISKQMVGIFITIWIRKGLRRFIHDVKVACVGCGLMGYYGNKGSVSVSMKFDQTSLCFVCTHLTSGEKEGDEQRRNSDVTEILRRTMFPKLADQSSPSTILAHDQVIWLGDLNYRLSMSNGETKPLLNSENWDALLRKDQLKVEQNAGGVFYGWQEGSIEFAPTYKYKTNSTEYSNGGDRQRTPAWCDRILWKGKGLKQIDYYRIEYTFSDHRPVSAVFVAEVELLKRRPRTSDDFSMLDFSFHKLQNGEKQRDGPFIISS